MSNPTEIVSRWIDAQPEGALIRSLDLEHVVDRNQASRELARLARRGRLMRVARGMYVAVAASHFGPVPPPADKMIQSLACITGRTCSDSSVDVCKYRRFATWRHRRPFG
jgi:hypothetical protein